MMRRSMMAGLLALPFASAVASAADRGIAVLSNRSVRWKVPKNTNAIRVRSWDEEGNLVLDRNLTVNPNQLFQIDVVE